MRQMLIKNRYRKTEQLAKTNFCETSLADDVDCLNRKCVLKELTFSQENPDFYLIQEKFQQEAKVLHDLGEAIDQIPELRHQIPKLYAYFSENNQFYLVQEWVQGETLAKKIAPEKVLSENEVIQFLLQILPVIQFMHDCGIVHRDIKPNNLIIREFDGKPVLIDFGIVKRLAEVAMSLPTCIFTPHFGAPEQELGQQIHPNTDLYGLGITAIYALTGKHPKHWVSDSSRKNQWRQFAVNVSSEFGAILDKAIQHNPRNRYSTAQEMLEAIQSLIPEVEPVPDTQKDTGNGVAKGHYQSTHRRQRQTSRLRLVTLSLCGAIVSIGSGLFYFNYQNVHDRLLPLKEAHERGDHSTCIAEAKQFSQSYVLSYFNPVAEAEQLGNECAIALDLQNYLRNDVPRKLQEENESLATTAAAIKPLVRVSADKVVVIYDTSSDPTWNTEPHIKSFARFFMTTLYGGTSDSTFSTNHISKKYKSFAQLIVSPQGSNSKAVITAEQWNAYIRNLDSTSSPTEREMIVERFFDQIQFLP